MNNDRKINTFAIHTLGCKVNLFESNSIKNDLIMNGLVEVPFTSKADVYIINTCTVTNKADAKSRLYIKRAYAQNKDAIIVVAGCMSQVNKDLMDKLKISIQIGNKYKNSVFDLINEYIRKKERIYRVENLLAEKKFEQTTQDFIFLENTRAFIKIQDGCNFMCSYCIIPFSRGRQRSQKMENIIDKIKTLVANNFKEIVLTGVNTAGYLDENNNTFFDLLNNINKLEGEFRIRISSLEPFQINDEIIELVTTNKKRFCQHWHICLQSGSDEVLKKMNRKYTTNEFFKLMQKILNKSPLTNFTTDYIVGFPTETEEDQKKSVDFLNKIKLYDMHIFPYSKRNNTRSSYYEDIKDSIKKERVKEITKVNYLNKKENLKKYIGQTCEVLFEKKKDDEKMWSGYSNEYCRVMVESKDNLENKLLKVKITKMFFDTLVGEIID